MIEEPKQPQQPHPSKNQMPFPHSCSIELDPIELSPVDPDVFMLTTFELLITNPSLIALYSEPYYHYKWFQVPIHTFSMPVDQGKAKMRILLQDLEMQNLKQFADQQRGPSAQRWIRDWIIELGFLGLLEINKIKKIDQILLNPHILQTWVFPQITLHNIFVKQFWGRKTSAIEQSQISIQNPLTLRLTSTVSTLNDYFNNLSKIIDSIVFLDQLKVKQFQSLRDLQRFYFDEIKNYHRKQPSLHSLQMMIKQPVSEGQKMECEIEGSLTGQEMTWIKQEAGIKKSLEPTLICKCSQSDFSPKELWENITEVDRKGLEKGKCLLILTVRPQKGDSIHRVAFYSPCFPTREACVKNPTGFYIPDPNNSSLLFNLSLKTVHALSQSKFALGYNPNLLLTIGKCDIILSAFNVTNLCYFPVSYSAGMSCENQTQLCGGRNIKLLEVQLYKLRRT